MRCVCVCVCVLQALQYLRKLCNHPGLVLTPQHPEYKRITEQLAAQNTSLRDIQHAPKLSALKQVPVRWGGGGLPAACVLIAGILWTSARC